MKKVIWINGLIAGGLITTFMLISMAYCYTSEKMEGSMFIGFTAMFLSFSFIVVGIKNYRDKQNNGAITFGRAFLIGIYISIIASTMYVIGWMFEYHLMMPDYMDKFINHKIQTLDQSGLSVEKYQEELKTLEGYRHVYESKIAMVLYTYMEILPVGLVVSIVAAIIMKKKPSRGH